MSCEIITGLKALKLHGMAQSYAEITAQARHGAFSSEQFMHQLIAAERVNLELRLIAYQMSSARLPAHRDLARFDFSESKVDEALVRELHRCEFVAGAHNVVWTDPISTDSLGQEKLRC